jgi:hypothetical protein
VCLRGIWEEEACATCRYPRRSDHAGIFDNDFEVLEKIHNSLSQDSYAKLCLAGTNLKIEMEDVPCCKASVQPHLHLIQILLGILWCLSYEPRYCWTCRGFECLYALVHFTPVAAQATCLSRSSVSEYQRRLIKVYKWRDEIRWLRYGLSEGDCKDGSQVL